jgi:S-adenosylmethionine hydrolase
MKTPIVTLLTDFGTKDYYVASMKGVILGINPRCTLVDITHEVSPQNIMEGAFLLTGACSYFPRGTIHIAVVDPGVGSPRKPILIETKNYFFIGPDNGLLTLAARKYGIRQAIVLTNKEYFLSEVSATFHGRDIFAPVAGHLSLGCTPSSFGKRAKHWVTLDLSKPKIKGDTLTGEIVHIDRFGNLIGNIGKEELSRFIKGGSFLIRAGEKTIKGLKKGYYEGKKNELIALFGSGGYLEISVREGNAQKILKARRGDRIYVQNTSDD